MSPNEHEAPETAPPSRGLHRALLTDGDPLSPTRAGAPDLRDHGCRAPVGSPGHRRVLAVDCPAAHAARRGRCGPGGRHHLPGDPGLPTTAARRPRRTATTRLRRLTVTTRRTPDRRRLIVTSRPRGDLLRTRLLLPWRTCLETVNVGRDRRGRYVLPVPMGSPENYYGVGYFVDAVVTTTTAHRSAATPTGNPTSWR